VTSGNDANIGVGFNQSSGNVNIDIHTRDDALRDDVTAATALIPTRT